MQNSSITGARWGVLFTLLILGLVTVLTLAPTQFPSEAGAGKGQGLYLRTASQEEHIPKMWDIREDKNSIEIIDRFRESVGKDAAVVADIRDGFVRGEANLIGQIPHAKIEYNLDIRIPEVITPDTDRGRIDFLTPPSTAARRDILRAFLKQHNELIGMSNEQIDGLKTDADYINPAGNLAYVRFVQLINDVPVFRGELQAGFMPEGNRMVRVINNLAPGLDYRSLSSDFRNPADALQIAARHVEHELRAEETVQTQSRGNMVVFGTGDSAHTAEKMYFPTEPGVAVPAWRVLIYKKISAYYVIVDSANGKVLWHKNIVDDQTESATFNVYRNPNAFVHVHDSPAPLSPGPNDPTLGTQGVNIARVNNTRIGNEVPYDFNNNGWITNGANITDGNANEAGLDIVAPDGVDAPEAGDTACPGAGCRVFSATAWNPPPGNPAPGDAPAVPAARRGAVIQMFYAMNWYHDELYRLGFTELARNFQHSNFGRGGVENDRVRSEGQDSSGTNNANFLTPADGGRGRMQMFVWTGPTPDYDGTPDAEVIFHEVTHGTSNRLVGNGSGLGNQGGQMGEGWSDWYAEAMLSEPSDPINGIYTTGGYVTHMIAAGYTGNYYHGIRRFPRAPLAFTGGPPRPACGNAPCPHNPLSFRHINAGCDTEIGTTAVANISAFPRGPVGLTNNCSQVHNAGEIWSSALWETRSIFVTRLGWAAGNRRVLQVVTDGMKLSPINPTMIQMRDAIISAAMALPSAPEAAADVFDVREGFRRRGMGFNASVTSPSVVTESFDGWSITSGTPAVTSGNNLIEPNECNTINVPLSNASGDAATAISAVLSSSTPGVTISQPNSAYPNIPGGGGPVNNSTPFQVSTSNSIACFTNINFTLTVTYSGGGGGSPHVRNFSLPVGLSGTNYTFSTGMGGTIPAGGVLVAGSQGDDVAVNITLPAGWTSSIYNVAVTSLSASSNGMLTANGPASTTFTNTALLGAVGGANPTLFPAWDDYNLAATATTNGGIFTNTVGAAPNREFYIEWRGAHFDQPDPSPVSNHFAIKLTEGSNTVQYIHVLTGVAPNTDGVSATVGVQRAQTAGSPFTQAGFNTSGTITPGMVRTGVLPGGTCTPGAGPCSTVPRSRADFDGDGRSDLSVFRPSEGNWYLNRSTDGFAVIKWGIASDTLVPGDYDGDLKADEAVFRPDNNPANPDFYVLNSNGAIYNGVSWGLVGDIPIPGGDYDGDGRTDFAVFRPSNTTWYIINSSNPNTNIIAQFGLATDIPLAIDHDGDGRTNLAVFRPSNNTWYIARNTGVPSQNFDAIPFGLAGDHMVQADYTGDGREDVAMFRPSNGTWYIRNSQTGAVTFTPFGQSGDIPVPGDYDGDGTDDIGVYRAGTWYVQRSTAGLLITQYGLGTDTAIPNKYLPGVAAVAASNYVFATSTGGMIPAGGTLVAGSQADDAAVAVALPAGWNSTVYGVAVTSLSASTNGMLTINGPSGTTFTNTALLGAIGGANPTLFPAWDDYNLAATATTNGGIFANTVGTAPNRTFYVEWRGAHFDQPDPSPVSNNFAVKLTEGSDVIEYIYVLTGVAPNANGASATVGVQRAQTAGSLFTQVGFNTSGTTAPGRVLTGTRP